MCDSTKLTVFFEEPFWVGVFERISGEKLSVCKVTFGAEPKDYEVYAFILREFDRLAFSPAVRVHSGDGTAAMIGTPAANPKRRQREIKKQLSHSGTGTKSQQALQLQREAMKTERRQESRERREAEQERLYQLKREKRREKHRGH